MEQPGHRRKLDRRTRGRRVVAPTSSADAPCPYASVANRRAVLGGGVCLGVSLAVRSAGAQSDAIQQRPQEGDLLVRLDDASRSPLRPEDLLVGAGQTMAWPMNPADNLVRDGSRLNKVLLVRLDPGMLEPRTRERSADGVVAYSAICPHTACDVTNWYSDRQILECPCHNSQYDPKAGARVISGPSPRGLAALPLQVNDQKLVVARPFVGRLGIQPV